MGVTLLEKAFMMRILIADDHEMVRNATRRILESRGGIECVEARDGKEAVEQAPELKPDLIVPDISMPAVDGFDAAKEIKRHLPDVPILFNLRRRRILGKGEVA
jgi:DNA-binding NarL/FixJ family response regulator